MGGAATVCVQKEDGSRDSYMAYNSAMKTIPNDFSLLTAPRGARDAIADRLLQSEAAGAKGEYFEARPGLAPEWYGLNLVDLPNSRVWWCQGQNNLDMVFPDLLNFRNPESLEQNYLELANNGLLRVCNSLEEFPRSAEAREQLERVNGDRLRELCRRRDFSGFFLVMVPDWDRKSFGDDIERFYAAIQQNYALSDEEKARWEQFIAKRSGAED